MRFIVVDDEPLALRDLSEILRKVVPDCEIVGCSTASEAVKTIQSREAGDFDVAFLDIELGSGNGITLAKAMKDSMPDLHIIFVTAYDTYALRAFEVHATGYLLKPALEEDIRRELTFLYKNEIGRRVRVQTFGGFDVFVDGKPLAFKRAKAKELLALLIDRRGNVLTAREAMRCIYESLALKYRYTHRALEEITGERYGAIHMIGGERSRRVPEGATAPKSGRCGASAWALEGIALATGGNKALK